MGQGCELGPVTRSQVLSGSQKVSVEMKEGGKGREGEGGECRCQERKQLACIPVTKAKPPDNVGNSQNNHALRYLTQSIAKLPQALCLLLLFVML